MNVHQPSGDESLRRKSSEPLLSVEQLAFELSVARSWVYAKAEAGQIPSLKLGKYRRFRRIDVDAWLAALAD